jgi:hypothetical protein
MPTPRGQLDKILGYIDLGKHAGFGRETHRDAARSR